MNIALKEWSAVVRALGSGRQSLLLRKGGIAEEHRGGFELRHRDFLLFPTYEHQHRNWVRPPFDGWVDPEDGEIDIRHIATVTDAIEAPPLETLRQLAADHIWNDDFLTMRYAYKPELPLRLLILKVSTLAQPARIPRRPSYAGCKSWVHLTEEIDIAGARPAMTATEFETRRDSILRICEAGRSSGASGNGEGKVAR